MAIWQYSFHLVPRVALVERFGEIPATLEEDVLESLWSREVQPPREYESLLGGLLPEGRSWAPGMELWGREDSNCVQVWSKDRLVRAIFVRFDLRGFPRAVIEGVGELTRLCDAWWVGGHKGYRYTFPPSLSSLAEQLRASDAYRFVQDPEAFLRQLEELQ